MNYLQRIDESLRKWNTGEGVKAIMTLEQEILIKEARAKRKGREEGRIEGREEGLAEGREEGLSVGRQDAIRNLMNNMNLTADQAMDAIGIPKSEQHLYEDLFSD